MKFRKKFNNIFSKHPNVRYTNIRKNTRHTLCDCSKQIIEIKVNKLLSLLRKMIENFMIIVRGQKGEQIDFSQFYVVSVMTFSFFHFLSYYRLTTNSSFIKFFYQNYKLKINFGKRMQIDNLLAHPEQTTNVMDCHNPYTVSIGNINRVSSLSLRITTPTPTEFFFFHVSND